MAEENDTSGSITGGDRITLTIPGNLLAHIDAYVGTQFVDREDFIRTAARHYLEYLQERSGQSSGAA